MTDEQKKALKEAAEKATTGPWEVCHIALNDSRNFREGYEIAVESKGSEVASFLSADDPDARYIALANPATVLALLADLERLEGIVAKLPKTADGVPVVPGVDFIHWIKPNDEGSFSSHLFNANGQMLHRAIRDVFGVKYVSECYSTEAAARAALAREGK